MKYIQETYIFHVPKVRHILLSGHTILGFIVHEKENPPEFIASVKDQSKTKEVKTFNTLEEAQKYLSSFYSFDEQAAEFDPRDAVYIYHNKKLVCKCSDIEKATAITGYNKTYILNNWANDPSELKYNYSFSNKKL